MTKKKAHRIIFGHLEPRKYREMMGRVGCTFAALLKMASDFEKNQGGNSGCYGVIVAIVAFCIGDCADMRE